MNTPQMANQNQTLLNNFYTAFAAHNGTAMAACYHPEAVFSDPAFGTLNAKEVCAMWQMLLERSGGNLDVSFGDVHADAQTGSVRWTAKYLFSKTGLTVTNRISSNFEFRDGLIYRHHDDFDFYKWARQALGWKGALLGWSNFLQDKVRQQARASLDAYMAKTKS